MTAPQSQSAIPTRASRKRATRKYARDRVGNVIFYLTLVLFILMALAFAASDNPDKSLFGYRWYWVQTGSMEPELPTGSLAIVQILEPQELRVGDDATFIVARNGREDHVTHRIVEIIEPQAEYDYEYDDPDPDSANPPSDELLFITRGIANDDPDPDPRPASTMIGKVVAHLPGVGAVMAALRSNILPVTASTLCLIGAYMLARKLKK